MFNWFKKTVAVATPKEKEVVEVERKVTVLENLEFTLKELNRLGADARAISFISERIDKELKRKYAPKKETEEKIELDHFRNEVLEVARILLANEEFISAKVLYDKAKQNGYEGTSQKIGSALKHLAKEGKLKSLGEKKYEYENKVSKHVVYVLA